MFCSRLVNDVLNTSTTVIQFSVTRTFCFKSAQQPSSLVISYSCVSVCGEGGKSHHFSDLDLSARYVNTYQAAILASYLTMGGDGVSNKKNVFLYYQNFVYPKSERKRNGYYSWSNLVRSLLTIYCNCCHWLTLLWSSNESHYHT